MIIMIIIIITMHSNAEAALYHEFDFQTIIQLHNLSRPTTKNEQQTKTPVNHLQHHEITWRSHFVDDADDDDDDDDDNDRFYIALFSALEQTHCARMWFYMNDYLLIALFVVNIHRNDVLTALFGCYLDGATWNCCRPGAFCVHHTIQPCTVSLHAKPHT